MNKFEIIDKIININKPITIEKYIELCLYSENGYYKKSHVLGSKGDFITAPETSQLFGEIIGLHILNYWQEHINQSFNLIELGPGLGTLLLDILRITKTFKNFNKVMKIQLIESNIFHTEMQKINLLSHRKNFNNLNNKIEWFEKFNPIDKKPVIIIANEFFDCFPIRQFYKKNNQWYEKMIQINDSEMNLELVDFLVNKSKIIQKINKYNPKDIIEISKSRERYFDKICKQIKKVGGIMIIIDYGYFEKPTNFTLQSLYNNKKSHILDNVGNQDITSLVDFRTLIDLAKFNKLNIDSFTSQRDFFLQNGIIERTKKITLNLKDKEKNLFESGMKRLISNKHMGCFKVLIVSK